MANSPSTFGIKLHLVFLLLIALLTSSPAHCRGLSDLDEQCTGCWREIGKAVWQMVSGVSDTQAVIDDELEPPQRGHNDGLVALLMGDKGKPSLQDLECSACWVIVHRLKKKVGNSKDLADGFDSFSKRAMLNNGWV